MPPLVPYKIKQIPTLQMLTTYFDNLGEHGRLIYVSTGVEWADMNIIVWLTVDGVYFLSLT